MATKSKTYDSLEYYKILNVSPQSSEDEIRQNYRELAKFWHPDHNDNPEAVDMFQKISVAYDILKDEKSRLRYILLSMIYDKTDFPDMNALCILRNMRGQEDINIRALHLTEVTGKGLWHNKIDKIYYCSPAEASGVVRKITKHNWCYGFLGLSAIFVNITALFKNIVSLYRTKDNFTLFIHNALAYESEGKMAEALTSALMAKEFASMEQLSYLNKYIQNLGDVTPLSIKKWNIGKLKRNQMTYPIILLCVLGVASGLAYMKKVDEEKQNKVSVKEVVVFNNGQKVFSDVAVAKIFDIPVDIYDKSKLYHTTAKTQAMHGADKSFDVFATVAPGTTVRLTGYTGDKKWYRVMFDSGEMAFIEADKLKQGIGNEIPLWSKIYKE